MRTPTLLVLAAVALLLAVALVLDRGDGPRDSEGRRVFDGLDGRQCVRLSLAPASGRPISCP